MQNGLVFKQSVDGPMLTNLIRQARVWLKKQGTWSNVDNLEDIVVILQLNCDFPGGWCAFARDRESEDATVRLLMIRQYGLDFVNRIAWCL
jgi:hypothetical protein